MKHAAFTLIELLVVITIIALLAAILFPVLSSAKRAAQGASVVSSLRQIGIAHGLYTESFDGLVPTLVDDADKTDDGSCPTPRRSNYCRLAPSMTGYRDGLKAYGTTDDLFRVSAGRGPSDFKALGNDYVFTLTIAIASAMEKSPDVKLPISIAESLRCPIASEARSYVFDGGTDDLNYEKRYTTLYSDGSVKKVGKALEDEKDKCVNAYD